MRQGEVGRFIQRLNKAWQCLSSAIERPWSVISVLFGKVSHLVWFPFLVSKAYFSGSHYLRDLIDSSLISGCR